MIFDLVLKNANIIDENGDIKEKLNIYIKDGKIQNVKAGSIHDANECVDCSGLFVTPGLVNLHTHSPMNIFKGIAEDVNIEDWFNREIWPYESKMQEEDVYYGALLAIAEMLENGVTAFADHYFHADKIVDAVSETGIRGDIAPTIFGLGDGFQNDLDSAASLIERRNGEKGLINIRFGPHSPYTCPPDKLKSVVDRAKSMNSSIHIHVSETARQVEDSIRIHNKTPFEVLYDCGGFDIPVIIAHGLYVQYGDLDLINDKTFFAVSPKTYMKLGMGLGNIWKLRGNIQICSGTDGAASSNSLNPLEQIRLFALLGKTQDNSEDYKLKEMWSILMNGHRALSFGSGEIKKGYAADLVIWDLNRPNTMPVYNPLAAIIYSSDSTNITHTLVAGRFLKRDGKLSLDKESIVKDAYNHSKEILVRGKGNTNIIF